MTVKEAGTIIEALEDALKRSVDYVGFIKKQQNQLAPLFEDGTAKEADRILSADYDVKMLDEKEKQATYRTVINTLREKEIAFTI